MISSQKEKLPEPKFSYHISCVHFNSKNVCVHTLLRYFLKHVLFTFNTSTVLKVCDMAPPFSPNFFLNPWRKKMTIIIAYHQTRPREKKQQDFSILLFCIHVHFHKDEISEEAWKNSNRKTFLIIITINRPPKSDIPCWQFLCVKLAKGIHTCPQYHRNMHYSDFSFFKYNFP